MNRLIIIHETQPLGPDSHIVTLVDEDGDVLEQLKAHSIDAKAIADAARIVLEDLRNNEVRFKDVLIEREILRHTLRILQSDPPPDHAKLSARLHEKIRQWDAFLDEEHAIAKANAIEERRAAERQAALDEQAEMERKDAENSEHARRARLPHELLIGLYSPMDTLPTHDPAREIYLILRWYPDDDPAGPPRETERLTINEALKWQMEKAAVSENSDGNTTPHVSPFRPVTRLRNPEANW